MQIYEVLYVLSTDGFEVNLILLPKMTSIKICLSELSSIYNFEKEKAIVILKI
jgi:hypothetical protein